MNLISAVTAAESQDTRWVATQLKWWKEAHAREAVAVAGWEGPLMGPADSFQGDIGG